MAVCSIRISERGRNGLGYALAIANILAVLLSTLIILIGVYINVWVDSKMKNLADFSGDPVSVVLICTGCINVFFHPVVGKVGYDTGFRKTRHRFQVFLLLFILILGIISLVNMAIALYVFLAKMGVYGVIERSLVASLHAYKVTVPELYTINYYVVYLFTRRLNSSHGINQLMGLLRHFGVEL